LAAGRALLAPKPGEEKLAGDGAQREPDATDLFAGEGGRPGPEDGETDTEGGETDGRADVTVGLDGEPKQRLGARARVLLTPNARLSGPQRPARKDEYGTE